MLTPVRCGWGICWVGKIVAAKLPAEIQSRCLLRCSRLCSIIDMILPPIDPSPFTHLVLLLDRKSKSESLSISCPRFTLLTKVGEQSYAPPSKGETPGKSASNPVDPTTQLHCQLCNITVHGPYQSSLRKYNKVQ
jgi:hypothetical protein